MSHLDLPDLFSPPDMDWDLGAACGHGALAAALGVTVAQAMEFIGKSGWVNVPMMKVALTRAGRSWLRVAVPNSGQTAVIMLQFLGPWMEAGVPPQARCQHRHWVATKAGLIWDANTCKWETEKDWKRIIPDLLPKKSNGYETWGALVIL